MGNRYLDDICFVIDFFCKLLLNSYKYIVLHTYTVEFTPDIVSIKKLTLTSSFIMF